MPRIFADTDQLRGDELTLTGETHHYLTRVLRVGAGAELVLFDGLGQEVRATVARAGSRGITLTLGARTRVAVAKTPPVTLLQGLPRTDRMDLIIQKATELGAARVVPVRTERTARGQQGRMDRWQRIAREAARQCGRAEALQLSEIMSLDEALEEALNEALPEAQLGLGGVSSAGPAAPGERVVPWEEAPDAPSLARLVSDKAASVTVLIGPEGGLTPDEARRAVEAGFRVATLGPRILRTETAAIAALAIIQARLGGLGGS